MLLWRECREICCSCVRPSDVEIDLYRLLLLHAVMAYALRHPAGGRDPSCRRDKLQKVLHQCLVPSRASRYSFSMYLSLQNTQAAYPLPCVFTAEGQEMTCAR